MENEKNTTAVASDTTQVRKTTNELNKKDFFVFKINDGEFHWVKARNKYDALLVLASETDIPLDDIIDHLCEEVEQLPNDLKLKVWNSYPFNNSNPDYTEKTCAEWLESKSAIIASSCI